VVLIHGWEGSHHSKYLYSMGCSLHRAGYAVFRLNLRDHNDTHALNEDIFHSARIAEVVGAIQATQRLDGRLASLPLSVVGFSLGGNFALRVGLRGPGYGLQPRLCIGISPAIHPRHTLEAIDAGPRLFHRYFLHKWRQDMDDKAAAWPDRYDFRPYRRIANFVEITRVFAGQFTGYAGLDDYLEAYTVRPARMMDSPTPLAVLTARDDSIIPYADFNGLATRGSMVDFEVTDSGGHCGFIENWRMECWAETRVLELLARM
jgi:predicted alpha/beta-fold hydrolase